MVKTNILKQINDNSDELESDLDFILWKNNLYKELPKFWNSIFDEDKKILTKCLLSLWLFTFFADNLENLIIIP